MAQDSSTRPQKSILRDVALYAILTLFIFQLLSDFIEAIYAFGLLGTSLPPEIAAVLFLFSPLLLLLFPRGLGRRLLIGAALLMFLCRVAEPLLETRGRMLVAGLGTACALMLFPALLSRLDHETRPGGVAAMGLGLTLGLALSVLFRVLSSGLDISTAGWTAAIGWLLALVAAALLITSPSLDRGPERTVKPMGSWRAAGLCLGIVAVLILCYFAFASPNVIARWTGASYPLVVILVLVVLGLFAFAASRLRLLERLGPRLLLGWNILFVLSLVLTILAHQVRFPADPGAYPLSEPPVAAVHHVPLVLVLLLFPVILVDWVLLLREIGQVRPSPRALAGGFSLGSLFLLVLVFAHIFTTVYDYIPVAGPYFRDKFWLAYLVPGSVLALSTLLVSRRTYRPDHAPPSAGLVTPVVMVLLAAGTVAGLALTAARPGTPPTGANRLTILTYNVQQGYSSDGMKDYDAQLDLIRNVGPDLIGLQECDTNRIANGNSDLVRFFADRLDLYSYYGPKTVAATFGIALLSRYPIQNARTFYLFSEGEQTAAIEARIAVDGRTYHVYITHLGNGGPIVQQQAILQEVGDQDHVVLMGDFNFRPDTEQYRLTMARLDDAWLLKWPGGAAGQGIDPARRIDYIFVSPGTDVLEAHYLTGPQSDHPAMTATIGW